MNLLEFEREFARFKSQLGGRPESDITLLALVDFSSELRPFLDKRTFDTYVEEYITLLVDQCRPRHLSDLVPAELEAARHCLEVMRPVSDRFGLDQEIAAADTAVRTEWGTKLLFAGDVAAAVRALQSADAPARPQLLAAVKQVPGSVDELDALRLVIAGTSELADPVTTRLRSFLAEWELLRESTSREFANGLFVEKSAPGAKERGRIRELACTAEYQALASTSHEVTFEHQIKAPDDPFVGVVYNALDAVHAYFRRPGTVQPRGDHIHAHFQIRASNHTFTGDSIGLAAALVVFAQLLKHEIQRHEQCIASGAVFTGSIDREGNTLAISDETLPTKLTRTFFSSSELLVLPAGNLSRAQEALAPLQERYPRRRLQLVPARSLSDVISNRNVVRSEKVCAGQYVVRKVYRLGRLTRIQVPLLILLLYALVSLIYPPAWIAFDRNPAFVWINDAGDLIIVSNRDSTKLWAEQPACVPIEEFRGTTHDLDGDGKQEVIYVAGGSEAVSCPIGVRLYVHDHDGGLRFDRPATILGEYPGDTIASRYYSPRSVDVIQQAGKTYIVSSILASYPARTHLTVWSTEGEQVGWYVHAGHQRFHTFRDTDGDGQVEFVGLAVNNRAKGMALFVLRPVGSHGVSPPYSDPGYDLSWVKPGNQLHYVLFPLSDLARAESLPYELITYTVPSGAGSLRVDVGDDVLSFRSYYFDSTFRVTRVALSDLYRSRRQAHVAAGHLPHVDEGLYLDQQRAEVTYWTVDGWRTEVELSTPD